VQKVSENVKTSAARRLNAVVVNGMRVDGTLLNAISYSLMVKMLLLVDPKDQDGKMPCAMSKKDQCKLEEMPELCQFQLQEEEELACQLLEHLELELEQEQDQADLQKKLLLKRKKKSNQK
jgi:hypothetical protein